MISKTSVKSAIYLLLDVTIRLSYNKLMDKKTSGPVHISVVLKPLFEKLKKQMDEIVYVADVQECKNTLDEILDKFEEIK